MLLRLIFASIPQLSFPPNVSHSRLPNPSPLLGLHPSAPSLFPDRSYSCRVPQSCPPQLAVGCWLAPCPILSHSLCLDANQSHKKFQLDHLKRSETTPPELCAFQRHIQPEARWFSSSGLRNPQSSLSAALCLSELQQQGSFFIHQEHAHSRAGGLEFSYLADKLHGSGSPQELCLLLAARELLTPATCSYTAPLILGVSAQTSRHYTFLWQEQDKSSTCLGCPTAGGEFALHNPGKEELHRDSSGSSGTDAAPRQQSCSCPGHCRGEPVHTAPLTAP